MSKGRGMSTDRSHDTQPLLWLCIAQGCERFAFVSMLPLFAQYVQEPHGMSAPMALSVLSIFQALSYLGGLPGGWFADHKIGAKAASVMGALLLGSGYVCMLGSERTALWMSLALLIAGHSVFRPALHVRIASVIAATPHERERGFLWHYLAANLGYAAGGWFGEWAHRAHGWNAVFVGAAIACAVAGGTLISCRTLPDSRAQSAAERVEPDAGHSSVRSMRAVWLLCGVSVVFWLTAQQAGTSLTVFAANHVAQNVMMLGRALRIGPGHFASLHGLMVIALVPLFLFLHGRRQDESLRAASSLIWGYVATAAAFSVMTIACLCGGDRGRISSAWLVACYALLSIAEVLLAPLGVSLITRLAPPKKEAQAIGLWFAASGVGSAVAAAQGLCWDRWPHHRYFTLLTLLALVATALLVRRARAVSLG